MMGIIDWESAMVIGAVAVFLVGMAAALGGVTDRRGTTAHGAARSGRRRRSRPGSRPMTRVSDPVSDSPSMTACDESLRNMDEALASRDTALAAQSWLGAYRAARGDQRWENLIAVGGARLRVATIAGGRKDAEAKARELYLLALFRARQQGSLEGLLKTAESCAALGDYRVADQALRIAEIFARGTKETATLTRLRGTIRRLAPEQPGSAAVGAAC